MDHEKLYQNVRVTETHLLKGCHDALPQSTVFSQMTNDVAAKRQYRSPSQIARDRAADDQRRREKAEERERRKAKDKAEKEERDAARAKRKDETAIKAA